MVSCLGRVIILIRPSLFFMSNFRRASSVPNWRRWLSPTGRTRPLTRRRLPVRWRWSAVTVVIQSTAALAVSRDLVHALTIVVGLEHTLETTRRAVISFTCGSFGSSKRRNRWGRPSCYPSRLRLTRMRLIMLMRVAGPWRRCSVIRDWSDLRRGTVTTSVGWYGARCTMATVRWKADTGTRSPVVWIRDTIRGGCLLR